MWPTEGSEGKTRIVFFWLNEQDVSFGGCTRYYEWWRYSEAFYWLGISSTRFAGGNDLCLISLRTGDYRKSVITVMKLRLDKYTAKNRHIVGHAEWVKHVSVIFYEQYALMILNNGLQCFLSLICRWITLFMPFPTIPCSNRTALNTLAFR